MNFQKQPPSIYCRLNADTISGEKLSDSIVSTEAREITVDAARHAHLEFRLKLKISNKTEIEAKIQFGCAPDMLQTSRQKPSMPALLIQQEDIGGRYFRHIAWQQRIAGINWSGLIAYSDYLFGDGTRLPTYLYLICPASAQCFSFEIDPKIKVSSKSRVIALAFLKDISMRDRTIK